MNDRSWASRISGFCFGLLVAAVMVYTAVQLIRDVFWWLLGIVMVLAVGASVVQIIRHRNEGW